MKRLTHIMLFAALCVGLVASCTKSEESSFNPDKVKVMLDFSSAGTRAASSMQQGDQIEDVMVWAYAVDASGNIGDTPVGWATKSFTGTYVSTEGQSLYMELPKNTADAKYHFVAVVNKAEFGKIYKAGSTTELTLGEHTTHTELSTARFAADIANFAADKAAMPVSHWAEVKIPANTPEVDVDMTVYRAVANLTFSAALKAEDVGKAVVRVDQVTLCSKDVANNEGFLLSDHPTISDATTSPSAFGVHSDLARTTYQEAKQIGTVVSTATMTQLYQRFIYENHIGMAAAGADFSKPDNYPPHGYYLKIDYSFSKGTTIGATPQTAFCYMPLPAVVRNKQMNVKATFDVTLEGKVYLQYVVVDWKDGGQMHIDFAYPTYNAFSAVEDASGNLVYSKPTTSYAEDAGHQAAADNAFVFKFQMTAPAGQAWTVVKDGNNTDDFTVQVFDSAGNLQKNGDNNKLSGFVASEEVYTIKVYPRSAYDSNASRSVDVGITYTPSWTGLTERLLINAGSGNATKWPDSGANQHYITVTQIAN